MDDDSGLKGLVTFLGIGANIFILYLVIHFFQHSIPAGLAFLFFGVPLAETVLYWLMMVVLLPVIAVKSRQEK